MDHPAPAALLDDVVRPRAPRVIVFDSGLGGLTVLAEVRRQIPDADILFAADDAVFPYGRLREADLIDRVAQVMGGLIARHGPDAVVIACNTASTAVLPPLRAMWPQIDFVGTVPAIKPAAALSKTGLISVLATPGTVARDYTRDLVQRFASACDVALVGAPRLAGLCEAAMRGEPVDDGEIAAECAGAFVERDGRGTDVVVLACTHYPLLLDRLERLAPWPVAWIDPAPAIARRASSVLEARGFSAVEAVRTRDPAPVPALFTRGRVPGDPLRRFLESRGVAASPSPETA